MQEGKKAKRASPPWLSLCDGTSDDVAWRLVAMLFEQRLTMAIPVAICVGFGLIAYIETASTPYLVAAIYIAIVALWRLWQSTAFARLTRATVSTPEQWAWRNLASGWATAVGWSLLTTIVLHEPPSALLAAWIGIHAGLVSGGAIRNNAIPPIAVGQVVISTVPLIVNCLGAPSTFLRFYACVGAIHIVAAIALIRYLHSQTVRSLRAELHARALASELARANEELSLVNDHLRQQVATDPLTGLMNRRAFDLAAAREWRLGVREQRPLSVLMIDIDHFKAYNDHYGHQAGDDCLRAVADILRVTVRRPTDVLARFGGEEFVVVLPSTYQDGAVKIAADLQSALDGSALDHAKAPLGRVTVSIGIACAIDPTAQSLADTIAIADRALYAAKHGGRNRSSAGPDPVPIDLWEAATVPQ